MAKKTKKKPGVKTPKRTPVKRQPVSKRAKKKKVKRKAKKKVQKKSGPKRVIKISLPKEIVTRLQDNVRNYAGHLYAATNYSIADMARHPDFANVPQSTLETWSLHDKWVSQRQDMQAKVKARVQNVLANEITKERSTQLKKMVDKRDSLSDVIMQKLEKLVEDPDSSDEKLSSLLNVWVRLADLTDSFMDKLGEVIVPAAFPDDDELRPTMQITPRLTPEESRAAARLLLQMRRDEIRRARDGGGPDIAETPTLRLVDGK